MAVVVVRNLIISTAARSQSVGMVLISVAYARHGDATRKHRLGPTRPDTVSARVIIAGRAASGDGDGVCD